jgi:predicted ribosomally synthesized peptide with nif11-like leader
VSIEQAKLFIARVHTDDAFRARVLATPELDARMELIHREGFDCTAEEIAGVLGVLADATLEDVVAAGGAPAQQGPRPDAGWPDGYHPN